MKQPGDRIDRYVVEALLGRGGMGEVYEARDTRLGRRVALKVLPPEAGADAIQRMVREARAAAAFQHPNVVTIYDVGEVGDSAYIAMELIRGRPLRAFVGDAAVPMPRRLRWLADVARALAAAHGAGLVHRDVKPDNVIVRDDGGIKVVDFGIARRQSTDVDPSAPTASPGEALATLTERGVVVGTPRYSAPEQLRNEDLDGRADQFAWGVMAYELCTGRYPFRGTDSVSLLLAIVNDEPEPPAAAAPELPPEVASIVGRTLSKKAAGRFATMDAVADAVEPFAEAATGTSPTRVQRDGAPTRKASLVARIARRTGRVLFWVLASIGGLIVGLIVFGVVAAKLSGKTGNASIHFGADDKADAAVAGRIAGLGCRDARLEGARPGAKPDDLARAIGVGACARLATEVGVDWKVARSPDVLDVAAKLADGSAEITLAVAGASATGKGPTPIEAIVAATRELAPRLSPPPLSPEQIREWGAGDEAGARRIERVWRRMVLNIDPDVDKSVRDLVASDPDSPWPHLFASLTGLTGSDAAKAARDRATALLDRLPPSRKAGLAGLLRVLDSYAERKEGMRLMRDAYTQSPDDADIAGLFAAVAVGGSPDEAFAVVDRLAQRFPTRSIVPLRNAIVAALHEDRERDARFLKVLQETLPETKAWDVSIQHLVVGGRFDEARAAVEFGRALGMASESTSRVELDVVAVGLELAALQPAVARDRARPMLADPRPSVSTFAAQATLVSYLLECRIADADATTLHEIERQRGIQSQLVALDMLVRALERDRWLGRPAPAPTTFDWADAAVRDAREVSPAGRARFRGELALARWRRDPARRREAEQVLADVDGSAEAQAAGDREVFERIRVSTVALARALKGDAEAVQRWQDTTRAPTAARRRSAFDAALALEARGKRDEAEAAYRMAATPADVVNDGFGYLAARVRLARLLRARGAVADADAEDAAVGPALAHADPGVVAALLAAK